MVGAGWRGTLERVRSRSDESDDGVTGDLASVLDRLRRLEEIESARCHCYRYAAVLDDPTPERIAALFAEQGTLRTRRGEFTGRAAITAFYRDRLAADPSEKRHFVVNPAATWLGPGLVEISSHFLFTGRGADTSTIGWGTYLDRIRIREDVGSALFEEKTIALQVGTDLETGWPAG